MRPPTHTRRLILLVAVVALVATAVPAGADTRADLLAAQAQVAGLREEAEAAAADYQTAYASLSETQDAIATQEVELAATARRLANLEARAAQRAVEAYMGGTTNDPFGADAESALDAGRRTALLDNVAADDVDLVEQLGTTSEDLEVLRVSLDELEATQDAEVAAMQAASDVVEERLDQAEQLEARLEAQYAAELAEQRRREAEERARREAAEQARREAAAAAARPTQTTPSGRSGGSSGGGSSGGGSSGGGSVPSGYACPVPGSSFVDSWARPGPAVGPTRALT